MTLTGHVAAVTGGGRGIGKAVAEALAAAGAAVAVGARTEAEISAVATGITGGGGRAVAVPLDVGDDDSVASFAGTVTEALGTVDIVVNCAGVYLPGRFLEYDLDDFRRLLEVNYLGTVRVTRAFLRPMLARGWGRIVNVASTAGKYGSVFQTPYNASKHAVVGLTRALGLELAATGVTVNAVCPGFVDTPMIAAARPRLAALLGLPEEEIEPTLRRRVPLGRFLRPEEVADLVLYLASEAAGGMTGQALTISGGLVLV